MKNYKKLAAVILLGASLLPLTLTYAQTAPGSGGSTTVRGSGGSVDCSGVSDVGIRNPLRRGTCSLYELVKLIANDVIMPIGGVIVVFFIIYSGFLLVISAGNEEKLKTGKRTLMWALIGAAILLGSWVIALAIENTIKQIAEPVSLIPDKNKLVIRDLKS